MNFSDFKKWLGAEPRSRDADIEAARRSGPEFEQAAAEAEAFEDRLEAALRVAAPDELLARIREIPDHPAATARRRGPRWMAWAMAASVVVAAGAATLVWNQSQRYESVQDYVAAHFEEDGEMVLSRAVGFSSEERVHEMMARIGHTMDPALVESIRYIKICPTPDGRGAHMVVHTDTGPVTVIFMPGTEVRDGQRLAFDGMHAELVALDHGAAAIIGAEAQTLDGARLALQGAIHPLQGSA
ncbi:MAG: DUF3379 family protein [Xanthomonadales bacterium]|nr:DUF3379 family protein [Xanthomonadales bacterium]